MSHTRLKAGGGTISGSEGLSTGLWTSMSGFTPSLAVRLPKRQPIQPLALLYLSISSQATKYLEQIERRAIHARSLTNGRFVPLVFSAGGMMSEATRKELGTWGEKLEAKTFQRMKTMVLIALLKARTRSFEAGRPGDMGNALEELSGDS